MTIQELLKGTLPNSMPFEMEGIRCDIPITIRGSWTGTITDLVTLNIPISMAIYSDKDGYNIFYKEQEEQK